MYAEGFPPVADAGARVLVLGSLPGPVSLRERQYYAQPRNAFWRIVGILFDASPERSYEQRLEILRRHHVAPWDVCASAHAAMSFEHKLERWSIVGRPR
jgi:hypoxanthine-DNA glycosylase